MKVIQFDNFCRDYISDRLIAENVDETIGAAMVESLTRQYGGVYEEQAFRLVPDDYRLYAYEPPV